MRRALRWLAGLGLGLAVAAAPAVAGAGVITVWPDQLAQEDNTPVLEQSPAALHAEGSFYSVLRLPLGSVIDGFKVTYSADYEGFDWCTYIRRVKLGALPEDIMSFGRLDVDPGPTPAVPITTIVGHSPPAVVPLSLRRVARGYRYYLHVDPENTLGKIHSVQVVYH